MDSEQPFLEILKRVLSAGLSRTWPSFWLAKNGSGVQTLVLRAADAIWDQYHKTDFAGSACNPKTQQFDLWFDQSNEFATRKLAVGPACWQLCKANSGLRNSLRKTRYGRPIFYDMRKMQKIRKFSIPLRFMQSVWTQLKYNLIKQFIARIKMELIRVVRSFGYNKSAL